MIKITKYSIPLTALDESDILTLDGENIELVWRVYIMSKLSWDDTGTRCYELGVSKGVLYTQKTATEYSSASNVTIAGHTFKSHYNTGVAWNGLTSISESPDGAEPNDIYADNIKYASLRSAETYGGTIEAYTYPDEWAVCDGSATPVTGVYVGQQSRTPFGLCYRTEMGNDTAEDSDDGYKLHIVWNATASPSERQYETINDSPDAITFSWEFDTTPVTIDGFKATACITIDTTKLTSTGKTNLEALETILYGFDGDGSSATYATLPDPEDVLAIMGYTAA